MLEIIRAALKTAQTNMEVINTRDDGIVVTARLRRSRGSPFLYSHREERATQFSIRIPATRENSLSLFVTKTNPCERAWPAISWS